MLIHINEEIRPGLTADNIQMRAPLASQLLGALEMQRRKLGVGLGGFLAIGAERVIKLFERAFTMDEDLFAVAHDCLRSGRRRYRALQRRPDDSILHSLMFDESKYVPRQWRGAGAPDKMPQGE